MVARDRLDTNVGVRQDGAKDRQVVGVCAAEPRDAEDEPFFRQRYPNSSTDPPILLLLRAALADGIALSRSGLRCRMLLAAASEILPMIRSRNSAFVVSGAVILALTLVGYWVRSAIREESNEVRASIAEAANDLPFARLGKELERQLDDWKISSDKTSERARRDPHEPVDLNDLLGQVVRTGHRMSSRLDDIGQEAFRLRPVEVEALGAKLNADIGRQLRVVADDKTTERMRRLAKPFLADVGQSAKEIRFYVVDDEQINAFAHIGGHVYVTTGLLGFVRSEEELQFVLGHEIAHVKLGHCAAAMTYSAQAAKLTGDAGERLTQLAYHAIAVGYSEDHEFAADALSCRQAPVCRAAAIAFLQRLERIHPGRSAPSETGSEQVPLGADLLRELDNHFRTHPDTKARIEQLSSRR